MKKLIAYSIFSLLNLMIFMMIIIKNIETLYISFMFLTIISFTCSTFYLFIVWVYEIKLHLNRHNSDRMEEIMSCRFYKILRERFFKYVFQMSLTVCIGYWFLCMAGDDIMTLQGVRFLLIFMCIALLVYKYFWI